MYVIPNFGLTFNAQTCVVANTPGIPAAPYRLNSVACNLAYGHRVNVASSGGTNSPGVPIAAMSLLMPKGTDIRGPQDTVSFDMVEVPAGSGRWYWCAAVDDIGKGYPNEHRYALLFALRGSWAAPYA